MEVSGNKIDCPCGETFDKDYSRAYRKIVEQNFKLINYIVFECEHCLQEFYEEGKEPIRLK